MTTTTNDYLDAADIESIQAIENSRLSATDKAAVIDEIRAEAWRRQQAQSINVAKRDAFSIESLTGRPKDTPDGWDEAKARVKAQLEKNRMDAPIEGTRNSAFYAAEQREAVERQRVQDWKHRKEMEISLMRENRIKRQIDEYTNAKGLEAKKAAMERLSPEALARITNRGNG